MKQRRRIYYTEEQKALMWDRWLSGDQHGRTLTLLLGLSILFVIINVPLIGGAISLVAVIVGLGLIAQWLRGLWADRSAGEGVLP